MRRICRRTPDGKVQYGGTGTARTASVPLSYLSRRDQTLYDRVKKPVINIFYSWNFSSWLSSGFFFVFFYTFVVTNSKSCYAARFFFLLFGSLLLEKCFLGWTKLLYNINDEELSQFQRTWSRLLRVPLSRPSKHARRWLFEKSGDLFGCNDFLCKFAEKRAFQGRTSNLITTRNE